MKILVITARAPYPVDDGWKMRTSALIETLVRAGNHVELLTYLRQNELPSPGGNLVGPARTVSVRRSKAYSPADLLRGLIGAEPFPVHNYRQDDFARTLAAMEAEGDYDVLLVEDVVMAQYGLSSSIPLKVLDMHNIESSLMRRFARCEPSWPKSLYARLTAVKLERYEREVSTRYGLVTVCSSPDMARLRDLGIATPVQVVPNGVWSDSCRIGPRPGSTREIVFVGRLDYHANITGAKFLVEQVLPELTKLCPEARLSIVGKNPGPVIMAMAGGNVSVHPDVPQVAPYLERASVVVVPLLVGGGTRLKILEAMASGRPVVSTRLGAEGIDARDGVEIALRDIPAHFAAEVARLLGDEDSWRNMANNAREFVAARYDWNVIGAELNNRLAVLSREMKDAGAAA